MTKQEEIREGMISKVKSIRAWSRNPFDPFSIEGHADDILNYLHSQGAVLKVEGELPEPDETCPLMQGRLLAWNINLKRDGYTLTEPLIEVPPEAT